jgi:hypothetical protein
MASSRSSDIADAYTVWLNDAARSWPLPTGVATLSAARLWAPDVDLKDLDSTLLCEVVPATIDPETLSSRALSQNEYLMIVFLRQRYTPAGGATTPAVPNSWVDDRVGLVEAISKKTRDLDLSAAETIANLPAGSRVTCKPDRGVVVDPLCDYLALQNLRTFESAILVTWLEMGPR